MKTIFPAIDIEETIYAEDKKLKRVRFETLVRKKVNDVWYLISVRKDSIISKKDTHDNELLAFIRECYHVLVFYVNPYNFEIDLNQEEERIRLSYANTGE